MDSASRLQHRLHDNQRELLTLALGVGVLALLNFTGLVPWLLGSEAEWIVAGLLLLGGVVVLLSQQVANQAELLAEALGEPYGTLVLTLSVIVIELSLIGSTMLTGDKNPTLARDSMFSVLMIALTGITGFCMTLTSWLSRQNLSSDEPLSENDLSGPNMAGSMVFYNLISTMSVLVLIIPNFSTDTAEGNFSLPINVVLSVVSVGVYTIFLVNQMGPYRCFFMDPSERLARQGAGTGSDGITHRPWQAGALLLSSLAVVVVIAESMGRLIEQGVNELGLPAALAGILVAMLILIPEVLNAIQATRRGQLQRALNTLFGSVLATISLTVPAVLVIGEITGTDVILGLDPAAMVLLALTLFLLRPHPKVLGSEGLMLLVVFLFWLVLELV
jgi:Ca2+:H+ antiporter